MPTDGHSHVLVDSAHLNQVLEMTPCLLDKQTPASGNVRWK